MHNRYLGPSDSPPAAVKMETEPKQMADQPASNKVDSPMHLVFKDQCKALDILGVLISTLRSRLESVLDVEKAAGGDVKDTAEVKVHSDLYHAVERQTGRIVDYTEQIQRMIDRLEL